LWDTGKSRGISAGVGDRNRPPSQFLYSNHEVGENCKEEQGADNDKSHNLVEVTRISSSNHADAVLVHDITISDDANADDSVEIGKIPSDVVL